MSSRGIYHEPDGTVRYYGTRKLGDPAGMTWQPVADTASRSLLGGTDIKLLRWDGAVVVLRDQADRDAIAAAEVVVADDRYIDHEHLVAYTAMLLDEINALRSQHGLPGRTPTQIRAAFKTKLGR